MLTPYIERMQCISLKTTHDCVLIDLMCFDEPWTRNDFAEHLIRPYEFGRVVVGADGVTVLGYIVYAKQGGTITIVRMAVAPVHQDKGVGASMLRLVLERTCRDGYCEVRAAVPEAAIGMQCCLRKSGFYGELATDGRCIVFSRRS